MGLISCCIFLRLRSASYRENKVPAHGWACCDVLAQYRNMPCLAKKNRPFNYDAE